MSTADMKELVEYIARSLVDDPSQVRVAEVEGSNTIIYELRVAPEDMGRVIGKDGNTARAIRTILGVATAQDDKKAKLDLTVQFLDADGAVIDRVDNSIGLKAGQKTSETKLTTLKYVVPLIKSAKISAVAK